MKIVKIFIFGFLFLLTIGSCEKIGEKFYLIYFYNKTDYKIVYYVAQVGRTHVYPDTLLPPEPIYAPIYPSSSASFGNFTPWEERFENLPADTLSIFFFHPDTLEAYPWEVIREEYKILKRYDLSLEDLQELDFKVTYPPGPEMEGVKMYPEE